MKLSFKKQKKQGRKPLNQAGKPQSAFSYYAGDTPRKQDTVRERKTSELRHTLFNRLRLVPTIIAGVIILLSIAYSTTLSTNPGIVFTDGNSPYRSTIEYKTEASKLLESSVMYKSKLTIDTSKVETSLLKIFPELDAATLSLPIIGRRPTIIMHLRKPALILTTSSNAYIIDQSGKVVGDSKQLVSSVKDGLLTIQDQSGLPVKIGSQALTSESVTFMLNVLLQLKDKQLVITQVTLPITPNEVDIYIKDLPYYLKADITGKARLQIGAFLAAREDGINPTEYMDIRVEEKIFYK